MTGSFTTIEIPPEPRPIDRVSAADKVEPEFPVSMPAPGTYGASDMRAKLYGSYAYALRQWGRGLITAIEVREAAQERLIARQKIERADALERLSVLKAGSE